MSQSKIWRKNNLDRSRELQRNYLSRVRRSWVEKYKTGLECAFCGEKHVACLDFHHNDPATKLFNVNLGNISKHTDQEIRDEISKCTVLCSNCHKKLHYDVAHGTI